MASSKRPREENIDEERRPESSSKQLLDLDGDLLKSIMLKADVRSQVVSGAVCRTMCDISRDPLYHAERDRLAQTAPPVQTEPVYAAVYLPTMTAYSGAYPQAWDPAASTWRALPPLDFLPPGQIVPAYRGAGGYGAQGGAAPGLLFFHHLDVQPGYLARPVCVRLCVCNPVTRAAVFLEPPPRIGLGAAQAHLILRMHAGGAGFTVYDLGRVPRALRRLHVVPPAAPLPAGAGRAPAPASASGNSERRRTLVASPAQWTTAERRRPVGIDGVRLKAYAKPVLMEHLGVIRTLCLRVVVLPRGRPRWRYQALFVDYDLEREQWSGLVQAVRGVPVRAAGQPPPPKYDDVSLVCLGDDLGLWLLHSPPGLSMAHAAADPDPDPDPDAGDNLKALDVYVHRPEAKAFEQVDRGWVPESAVVAHGAAAPAGSSTICWFVRSSREAVTYDVVTRTWALGPPVPRIVPAGPGRAAMDYSEWPVANFQLSHARFL